LSAGKKFAFSIGAFVILALLCWNTMSGDPISLHSAELGVDFSISFRSATLLVLGFLAAVTAVNFWRGSAAERRDESKQD
jgi:hypothetical protein